MTTRSEYAETTSMIDYQKVVEINKQQILSAGFTLNQLLHTLPQVSDLASEAIKRIKHMPFDLATAYTLHTGDINSRVLKYFVARSIDSWSKDTYIETFFHDKALFNIEDVDNFEYLDSMFELSYTVQINPMSMYDTVGPEHLTVNHDRQWPRAKLPLYCVEPNIEHSLYVTYPLFDWYPIQILAALIFYQLPLTDYEKPQGDSK